MPDECPWGGDRRPAELEERPAVVALLVLLAVLVACAALWSLAPAGVEGAPAPAYREPAPLARRIEGGWGMTWGGCVGTCELSRGGLWVCQVGEDVWSGSWSLDGRTLTIRERRLTMPGIDPPEMTYAVELADDAPHLPGVAGTIGGTTPFALRPDGVRRSRRRD